MSPASRRIKHWREGRGILQFVTEELHATPDAWQEEALLLFASPRLEDRRISLQACAGPGKTALEAWCGWWFLLCMGSPGEHPKGAAVSISKENLKDNLWAEFAKWQGRSEILRSGFTWTANRIFANDHQEDWFLSARAWPKSANADEQGKTLSGLHAKYVLALIDESGAIPTTVLRAAEQALATCFFGKILQAGNPISLEGMLYAAANTLRHLWQVVRITGDPDDPKAWVHSPRVGTEPLKWALEQIQTYGRENPWVKSYILGEFPPASINSLLGIEDVEAAMARHLLKPAYEWSQKRIGVDVARFGDDRTVLFPRQGAASFKPIVMRQQNTVAIAARVAMSITKWTRTPFDEVITYIDDTGHWGHGVYDNLSTAGYPALPVVVSDPGLNLRYKNRRAECWLEMAKWVKAGGALPKIRELVAELTTPTYTFLAGKFVLEEKEQIKKRLGRSPDLGDALSLTFAVPDQPAREVGRQRGRVSTLHDGDPYGRNPGNTIHDFDPV